MSKISNVKITGIDISQGMIDIGRKKIISKGLENIIKLQIVNSEKLPFKNNSFDAITTGFGVRNFENLDKGLKEMYRVLNQNGMIAILEPSSPKIFPFKQLFKMYFHKILPIIGKLISKDNGIYNYLPNSVESISKRREFYKEFI